MDQGTRSHEESKPWWRRLRDFLWGYDFFISYHWKSGGAYATALAERLRDERFDVFLDRAEFAAGEDWEKEGKRALWNARKLIVIATREAVTESDAVEMEVRYFSQRGRHIIEIVFGETLQDLERSTNRVLRHIPQPTRLYIKESLENLPRGPSIEDRSVLNAIIRTNAVLRRRVLRARILAGVITVLIASALGLLGMSAWNLWQRLEVAHTQAQRMLVEAESARSQGQNNRGTRLAAEALRYHDTSAVRRLITEIPLSPLIGKINLGNGQVEAIAFDPTGSSLAAGCEDGNVWIYDLRSETSHCLGKHTGRVHDLSFSPDGRHLVSANFGRELFLWNLTGAKVVCQVLDLEAGDPAEENNIFYPAFSPDGRWLAARLPGHGLIGIWDADDSSFHSSLPLPGNRFAFPPDGTGLAVLQTSGVLTANLANAQQRASVVGSVVPSLMDPDGQAWNMLAALFTVDGMAIRPLPEWRPGSADVPLIGANQTPAVLAFSRDGRRLAVAGIGPSVWVLDTTRPGETGRQIHELSLRSFARGVRSIETIGAEFDASGQRLLVATSTGTIVVWNADTGDLITTLETPNGKGFQSMAISRAAPLVAAACEDGYVYLWDLSGRPQQVVIPLRRFLAIDNADNPLPRDALGLEQDSTDPTMAIFRGDDSLLVSASDGSIREYTLSTGALKRIAPRNLEEYKTRGHHGEAKALAVVPGAPERLVSLGSDGLLVRDGPDWAPRPIAPFPEALVCHAVSANGRWLAVVLLDGRVQLRDLRIDQVVDEFRLEDGVSCNHIAVSASGTGLVLALQRQSTCQAQIRLVLERKDLLFGTPAADDKISAVALCPTGNKLAVAYLSAGKVLVWQNPFSSDRKVLREIQVSTSCLALSPDGSWLATGFGLSDIHLHDISSGELLAHMRGHRVQLEGLVFSEDGRRLASWALDSTARVWDLAPLLDNSERLIDRAEVLTGLGYDSMKLGAAPNWSERAKSHPLHSDTRKAMWASVDRFIADRERALAGKSFADWWAAVNPDGARCLDCLHRTGSRGRPTN